MDHKYEEALERAKQGLPIDEVFPELKESKDERIREELIGHCKDLVRMNQDDKVMLSVYEPWLVWLEKQKDSPMPEDTVIFQKGVAEGRRLEREEQKPAESDVIKGGDFISDGKRVFLVLANVKERNLGETGSTFCEGHILGVDGVVYCNGDNFKKFKRATLNERAKFIHDLKVGVELKEQPEVDLEKEVTHFVDDDKILSKFVKYDDALLIARHFYELGLNARKEE